MVFIIISSNVQFCFNVFYKQTTMSISIHEAYVTIFNKSFYILGYTLPIKELAEI